MRIENSTWSEKSDKEGLPNTTNPNFDIPFQNREIIQINVVWINTYCEILKNLHIKLSSIVVDQ